ncbi:MAG: hypothetical protein HGB19_12340 [Chlorobiales bacterium]|nr:hypothetical protein [Chlorobiales bacterium]
MSNKISILFHRLSVLILAFSMFSTFGCSDDDPVSTNGQHFDAAGVYITSSGVPVWDYFGPDYTAGDASAYKDTISIMVGDNGHWKVQFYDNQKHIINAPSDANKFLAFEFEDTTVAQAWWHPGEEGTFDFHMKGLKDGLTKVKIKVMHVDHPDFTTLWIPVVVKAQAHGEPIGIRLYDEESSTLLATAYLDGRPEPTTGQFSVTHSQSTNHIVAQFFDAGGIEFQPDSSRTLDISSSNTSIVTISGQDAAEPWAFKITGISAGAAELTFKLLHSGTVEKTFKPVSVTVN